MPDLPVAPGDILAGKYRVERLLGEGGHGVVVAAQHLTLGERVAIKVLRPEVAQDQETVARFVREARAAVRIKGEHVSRVLDVGSLPTGMPYMVMEHLEGADLATVIERQGWLPIQVAVDYVLQACEALAEAHGLGIVHRDIKPSNLFVTTRPDGSPCIKVLDFGISKAMPTHDTEMNLTQTQTVLGSPQYMAPEQMRSSKRVDGRTDIWALGTTLHELLTGHAPFEAQTMPELFAMILQDPPPRLSDRRPDIPPALEAVVARCLEKDPDKRYPNVHELARALAPMGTSAGDTAVERITRVAFNTARSSERRLPIDGGSAPGVDLSRTERHGSTKRTGSLVVKGRSAFIFAAAAAFMAVVGTAGIVVGVQRMRASRTVTTAATTTMTTAASAIEPPSAAAEPVTAPVLPATTPPESAAPGPEPSPIGASASTAASSTAKRPDPHLKVGPAQSAHPTASAPASASVTPPPPAPTPSQPSSVPGVASSRYD